MALPTKVLKLIALQDHTFYRLYTDQSHKSLTHNIEIEYTGKAIIISYVVVSIVTQPSHILLMVIDIFFLKERDLSGWKWIE